MESKESIAIDAILAIAQQLQVLAWLLQWVTQDETSASPILVRIVWLCLVNFREKTVFAGISAA